MLAYPEEITPALAEVLGMPPYELHPIWMALREVGVPIKTRYEAEVAAALHFLIPLALLHGEDWRAPAADKLLAMKFAHDAASAAA